MFVSQWCYKSGPLNVICQFSLKEQRSSCQFSCKDHGLVPAGVKLKSPLNTQEAIQIVKSTCRSLVKARINDCHRRLNYFNNKLQQQLDKLNQLLLCRVTNLSLLRQSPTKPQTAFVLNKNVLKPKNDRKLTRTGSGIFLPVS